MASYVRSARISTTHTCGSASTTQQIDLAGAGNVLGTLITQYIYASLSDWSLEMGRSDIETDSLDA